MKNRLKMACLAIFTIAGQVYSNQAAVARILHANLNGAHVYGLVKNVTPICAQNLINHDGSGKKLSLGKYNRLIAVSAPGGFHGGSKWVIPSNISQLAVDMLDDPIKDIPTVSEARYNQAWIDYAVKSQALYEAEAADAALTKKQLDEQAWEGPCNWDKPKENSFDWKEFAKDNKGQIAIAGIIAAGAGAAYVNKDKLQQKTTVEV